MAQGLTAFTNAAGGVLLVGESQVAGSASELTLTGLETLTNTGNIVFGGTSAASDNAINDKITAAGTAFAGTGRLFMDANLAAVSQAGCTTLSAADCLAVGSTAGLNTIVVNDTNVAAVSSYNPDGIALVTGSTNAGANFKLDSSSEWYNAGKFGGVLDKPGLFFYDLAWSPANGGTSVLIGVPDQEVFELSKLGTMAQSNWHLSTGSWLDRQADLRQQIRKDGGKAQPAMWMQVLGNWTHRDNSQTVTMLNKSYTYDVGYNQDTYGVLGGYDFLKSFAGKKGYTLGVQGGYLDSSVDFKTSATHAKLNGYVAGIYGSYMQGNLFVDGIFNANFMNLKHSVPTLPGLAQAVKGDVNSYGGRIEGGYKIALGGGKAFIEPLAGISYVGTQVSTLDLGVSGSANLPDTKSLRGSLGARLGTEGTSGKMNYAVSLTGKVWNEFEGNNAIAVHSPGAPDFKWNDDFGGAFGEVKLTGNLYSADNRLSAFGTVGYEFRSQTNTTSVRIGLRYTW